MHQQNGWPNSSSSSRRWRICRISMDPFLSVACAKRNLQSIYTIPLNKTWYNHQWQCVGVLCESCAISSSSRDVHTLRVCFCFYCCCCCYCHCRYCCFCFCYYVVRLLLFFLVPLLMFVIVARAIQCIGVSDTIPSFRLFQCSELLYIFFNSNFNPMLGYLHTQHQFCYTQLTAVHISPFSMNFWPVFNC